eukprot:scaffold955_cov325-Prasinococcus_capsulatus_cf.AAC.8
MPRHAAQREAGPTAAASTRCASLHPMHAHKYLVLDGCPVGLAAVQGGGDVTAAAGLLLEVEDEGAASRKEHAVALRSQRAQQRLVHLQAAAAAAAAAAAEPSAPERACHQATRCIGARGAQRASSRAGRATTTTPSRRLWRASSVAAALTSRDAPLRVERVARSHACSRSSAARGLQLRLRLRLRWRGVAWRGVACLAAEGAGVVAGVPLEAGLGAGALPRGLLLLLPLRLLHLRAHLQQRKRRQAIVLVVSERGAERCCWRGRVAAAPSAAGRSRVP